MKAVTWQGTSRHPSRRGARPGPGGADGRDRQDHLDRALRVRPPPVRDVGAVHDPGGHRRPRADGHRRGGRDRGDGDLRVGDRVVVPFNVSCGHCWMCDQQLYSQCETTQNHEYGTGAGVLRLQQALRTGPRRPGRVPPGPVRRLRARSRCPKARPTTGSSSSPTSCRRRGRRCSTPPSRTAGLCCVLGLGPIGDMCRPDRACSWATA